MKQYAEKFLDFFVDVFELAKSLKILKFSFTTRIRFWSFSFQKHSIPISVLWIRFIWQDPDPLHEKGNGSR